MAVANSKMAVYEVLTGMGLPVVPSLFARKTKQAHAWLARYGTLVVKPNDSSHGLGISTRVTTRQQLVTAFAHARDKQHLPLPDVVVQPRMPGEDCRILVVGGTHVFATQRLPASLTGDGVHSVTELADRWNKTVPLANRRIVFDEETADSLQRAGLTLDSVVDPGEVVVLRGVSNVASGGTCVDMTDVVCADARSLALDIARRLKMGVVGVDLLSVDITKTAGLILEVNASPAFNVHEQPTAGTVRHPAPVFVDVLFPTWGR
jgi:cyanophycin synthetase